MIVLTFLLATKAADDAGILLLYVIGGTLLFAAFCAYCTGGEPPEES